MANRRAEIDDLTASLNRCMLDNEALLAEKSVLVDEIAQYKQSGLDIDGSARSGLDGSSYSASSLRSSILSMAVMPYSSALFVGCEDGKIRCCY